MIDPQIPQTTLPSRLQHLTTDIYETALRVHRDPTNIHLLAVSKGQSIAAIKALIAAGQFNFGENYMQEALEKIYALSDYPLTWHFIGHLQRNKVKAIAQHFDWVHSVDNLARATALNHARPSHLPKQQVCIQVNLYDESTKGGIGIHDLTKLLAAVMALPKLQLRGLMTILPQAIDPSLGFMQLATLQQQLIDQGFALDTLSMGMSHDYHAAIAAGATWLRIGTALFGSRK